MRLFRNQCRLWSHTLLRWQHPRQIRMVLRALFPNPLQNLRLCHKLRPFPHQRHKLRRHRTLRPFQNPHPPHTLRLFPNLLMLRIHLRFSAVKNPLFFSSVGSR